MFRRVRIHPVVGGPGVVLVRRTNEGQMLGPRNIIHGAAVQIAVRIGLLIQSEGVASAQQQFDHSLVFRRGPVAIHDTVGLRQLCCFFDPTFQWSCHSDLPAPHPLAARFPKCGSPTARGTGNTLDEDPSHAGIVERMDSAMPTSRSKGGNFRPLAGVLISIAPSLCYPSPPAQLSFR